jgi:hypothetical protein
VWEEIAEAAIDMDELDKLFCKPPSEKSQKANKTRAKSPAKQVSSHPLFINYLTHNSTTDAFVHLLY